MIPGKPDEAGAYRIVAAMAGTTCSSGLRYLSNTQAVRHDNKIGDVLDADVYSPAAIENTHPDLFWDGIHGVEILFTVMGRGCKPVRVNAGAGPG